LNTERYLQGVPPRAEEIHGLSISLSCSHKSSHKGDDVIDALFYGCYSCAR